jgi:DNA helicase II / ATP-dependent DNA helicase PcrA
VTSFSRAAAAELVGRDLPTSRDRVGTLHSHCWHALGRPEIAEANVGEWNGAHPALAITPQKRLARLDGEEPLEDDSRTEKRGDQLLQQLSRLRGLMPPRESWPATLRQFEHSWTVYKQENGLLDFTDLIETCYRDIAVAPRDPAVIFADEAQDLNRMQLSLVRKWGGHACYFIIAGDDDQTIYSFTGAAPDAMLDPDIAPDHKIVLKQSYRVPRTIHGYAEAMIRRVTRRQEKEYLPRPQDGVVHRIACGGYKSPEYFILKSAVHHLERGQSVMFLAACSYMLRPLIQVLRKQGIPFHNPYRKSNGFWNPLRIGGRSSIASHIRALLICTPDFGEDHRSWTHGDLVLWAEHLETTVLRHGSKEKLAQYRSSQTVTTERLGELFETAAFESLMAARDAGHRGLLHWWRSRVSSDVSERAMFAAEVAARQGPRALFQAPQVVVGTIHSVKGGQADVVYLFPDLSRAGDAQFHRGGAARDSVIRQFYVGATRAKEELYVCQPESALTMRM